MFAQRPMHGQQPAVTTATTTDHNATADTLTVDEVMDRMSSLSSEEAPVTYDGDEYQCSICTTNFSAGERVVRVRCRHMFHGECWQNYLRANSTPTQEVGRRDCVECPNCRGVGKLIAIWNFIAPTDTPTQPGAVNLLTAETTPVGGRTPVTLLTPRSTATEFEFETPESIRGHQETYMFPTWAATDDESSMWAASSTLSLSNAPGIAAPTRSYLATTELPDGRPALLLDLGSVGNLASTAWVQRVAIEALKHGHQPQEHMRDKPLLVGGVGKGTQRCTHDCTLPIALQSTNGTALLGTYTTPTINGQSNVTGILGLLAIRGRQGIIDTGNNKLHFPGPGGAQIQLSPGSETYDLLDAPSGHLLIPCCHYDKLKQQQKPEPDLTLYNRGNGATSCSSAAAAPSAPAEDSFNTTSSL